MCLENSSLHRRGGPGLQHRCLAMWLAVGSLNRVAPGRAPTQGWCAIGLVGSLHSWVDHAQADPGGDADGHADHRAGESEDGLLPGVLGAHRRNNHDHRRGNGGGDGILGTVVGSDMHVDQPAGGALDDVKLLAGRRPNVTLVPGRPGHPRASTPKPNGSAAPPGRCGADGAAGSRMSRRAGSAPALGPLLLPWP